MNVGGLPIVLAFGGVESQYCASAGCATKAPDNENVTNKTARLDAIMNLIGFPFKYDAPRLRSRAALIIIKQDVRRHGMDRGRESPNFRGRAAELPSLRVVRSAPATFPSAGPISARPKSPDA
jgi:hypothetical protein